MSWIAEATQTPQLYAMSAFHIFFHDWPLSFSITLAHHLRSWFQMLGCRRNVPCRTRGYDMSLLPFLHELIRRWRKRSRSSGIELRGYHWKFSRRHVPGTWICYRKWHAGSDAIQSLRLVSLLLTVTLGIEYNFISRNSAWAQTIVVV